MLSKKMRQILVDEILSVDVADTESHLLEWQSLNTATQEALKNPSQLKEAIENISISKTTSLQGFLERKKMIKQALEDL